MTTDPAIINLPLAKRYGKGGIDAEIDRHLAAERREAEAAEREARIARKAAREAEKARPKLTAADVAGAIAVRDDIGWHYVRRVNAKSVTITTGHSWTERIPLDQIVEVRK